MIERREFIQIAVFGAAGLLIPNVVCGEEYIPPISEEFPEIDPENGKVLNPIYRIPVSHDELLKPSDWVFEDGDEIRVRMKQLVPGDLFRMETPYEDIAHNLWVVHGTPYQLMDKNWGIWVMTLQEWKEVMSKKDREKSIREFIQPLVDEMHNPTNRYLVRPTLKFPRKLNG